MEANATFIYKTEDEAVSALESKGIEIDDVMVLQRATDEGIRFGWFTYDEFEANAKAPEPPMDDVQGDEFTEELLDAIEARENTADPEDGPVIDLTAADDSQVAEIRPGDVFLRIAGAYSAATGRGVAQKAATKARVAIDVLDAATGALLDTVEPGVGAHSRDEPNENQSVLIALCTREKGATVEELADSGAYRREETVDGKKKPAGSWSARVTACERFGYAFRQGSRPVNDNGKRRWFTTYHLDPVEAEAAHDAVAA